MKKPIKTKVTKEEFNTSLAEKIEMVRMSVRAVTRGYRISRLISGTAGIGKSRSILEELREEQSDFVHISGGIKDARALFIMLYDNNDEDLIIFFDDTNNIFKDRESREILRVAVSNEKQRLVTYTDSVLAKNKFTYKSPLHLRSKIIIATNVPKKKIDPAIISRASAIEVIANKYEIMEYIGQNLVAAPPDKIDITWKQEVFTYLRDELGMKKVKQMDFRIFEDCCLWRCAESDPKKWKKLIHTLVV